MRRAQSLGHHHGIRKIQTRTAVFRGILQAEQTQIAEFLEQFMRRKFLGGLPGIDVRIDFLAHETSDGIGQLAVFGTEFHS